MQYVEVEVRRSFGSQGEVSIAIATIEDTAVAPPGSNIFLLTSKGNHGLCKFIYFLSLTFQETLWHSQPSS